MQITDLSELEIRTIQTALMAVSPVGGGSATFTLLRKLVEQTGVETIVDGDYSMIARFCDTVIDDAAEAGVCNRIAA